MTPAASSQEIKRQYRKLAAQYHPDRVKDSTSKETFLKITEANDILGDQNKKQMYDSSYGLGNFKNYINSKTVMLTDQNYDRLVAKSHEVWVIQVFDHESSLCHSFSDAWETMAAKYKFLKFGRIDFRSQQKLVHRLPFRALDFPFLFVYQQSLQPDFVEYTVGESIGNKLLQCIKDTLPANMFIIRFLELTELLEKPQTTSSLVFLNRKGFEDVLFLFESRIMSRVKFSATPADKFGFIQKYITDNYKGKQVPRYILIHPKNSTAANKYGLVEFIYEGYHTIANRIKYLDMPLISSTNINHLCPSAQEDDDSHDHLCLILVEDNTAAVEEVILREFMEFPEEGK